MKKIIVRIGNGLGNQLFTYAAAYSFAKKNNADLYVDDKSGFYKRNKYELNNFEISSKIVDEKLKFVGLKGKIKRKILHKLDYFKKKKKFIIEIKNKEKLTSFSIDQFKKVYNETIYIEGHFQSEKYFFNHKKNILQEFKFKKEIINQENKFINKIKGTNSVSIHIRQDKFLKNEGHKDLSKLNKENLELNIEIAKKGINYFDKQLENPTYFVCSNNFTGLKKIFTSKNFIFVDENLKRDAAYDLYLMSLCKHFILSPSTLHYWAAFLSDNKNKICVAPRRIKTKSGYYGFSNNKDINPDWWLEI